MCINDLVMSDCQTAPSIPVSFLKGPGAARSVRTREPDLDLAATTVIPPVRYPESITPCKNRLFWTPFMWFRLLPHENQYPIDPLRERYAILDSGFGRLEVPSDIDRDTFKQPRYCRTSDPRQEGLRCTLHEGWCVQNRLSRSRND